MRSDNSIINPEWMSIGTLAQYRQGEIVQDKVVVSASQPNEKHFPPHNTEVCETSYKGCPRECAIFESCNARIESGRV